MKLLLDCLSGKERKRPPFWFMRQAGRYLPEYREVRASLPTFLDLCYHPEKATEVTLQPIKRFDMDAAIIFSDILVIPHALGLSLQYVEKEGPLLETIAEKNDLSKLTFDRFEPVLAPVYEAVRRTRETLSKDKTLIGFAGAPWTLACYMIDGRGKTGFEKARRTLFADPEFFTALFALLEKAIIEHLLRQINAGADVVQLFDSWAGSLPFSHLEKWVIEPHNRIVDALKIRHPGTPVIGFPKSVGYGYKHYAQKSRVQGISVDMHTSMDELAKEYPEKIFQGNLDPLILATNKHAAGEATKKILENMGGKKFIFNLGHGMVPETPVANVEAVCRMIKEA